MSQAEALWESKLQIAGLACQDTRYKGPVNQTARLNKNNNLSEVSYQHLVLSGSGGEKWAACQAVVRF
jgi:hypothetical protein